MRMLQTVQRLSMAWPPLSRAREGGAVGDSELGSWSLFKAIPVPVLETPSSVTLRQAEESRAFDPVQSRPSPVPVPVCPAEADEGAQLRQQPDCCAGDCLH
jgi:hypothetical protein